MKKQFYTIENFDGDIQEIMALVMDFHVNLLVTQENYNVEDAQKSATQIFKYAIDNSRGKDFFYMLTVHEESTNKIVGILTSSMNHFTSEVFINNIYIKKEFREYPIFYILLKKFKDMMIKKSIRHARAAVYDSKAIALYEKIGFKKDCLLMNFNL